jgi:hypothetical protein
MYECDTIGCPEYVAHPGQLCLACQQREESDGEEDDYCPEHGYNPPENSGFALCPQCELEALSTVGATK